MLGGAVCMVRTGKHLRQAVDGRHSGRMRELRERRTRASLAARKCAAPPHFSCSRITSRGGPWGDDGGCRVASRHRGDIKCRRQTSRHAAPRLGATTNTFYRTVRHTASCREIAARRCMVRARGRYRAPQKRKEQRRAPRHIRKTSWLA